VLKTLRWSSAVLFLWLSASRACLADGGGRIAAIVEPAYTACVSAASSCSSVLRAQFRLQYRPLVVPKFSIRLRLSRQYQLSQDDNEDGSSEEQQASKFDPPFDVIDIKTRFSEADGRDHFEARAGYAYQHSSPNLADGYHTVYLSGDYYFGGPIEADGPSRRFDVLARVSRDLYNMAGRAPEETVQIAPTYTLPLNADGTTRVYGSYTRELRFSGGTTVATPSNRFDLGAIRDATPWLQLYGRYSLFATRTVPGTGKFVLGVEVTI
jgi:hypothetical protein